MLSGGPARTWKSRSLLGAVAVLALAATTAASASTGASSSHAAPAKAAAATCVAPERHQALATRLGGAITAALRSRLTSADPSFNPFDDVTVAVHDNATGVQCWYHSTQEDYSASAVKATILAALLLKAQDQHRALTATEKSEAWLMITQSDNHAATYLWDDDGQTSLQHFLNRAGMTQTVLNTWGAWGLTRITAHDESRLLWLLISPGQVLTGASRRYELYLMNHVIASQAWGVRAGAPRYYSWHIKNGWAPLPDLHSSPWVINSIGCFLHKTRAYTIVVLTHDNPSESYGIATVESVAWVINRALVPGAASVWPRAGIVGAVPDETLPAPPSEG